MFVLFTSVIFIIIIITILIYFACCRIVQIYTVYYLFVKEIIFDENKDVRN